LVYLSFVATSRGNTNEESQLREPLLAPYWLAYMLVYILFFMLPNGSFPLLIWRDHINHSLLCNVSKGVLDPMMTSSRSNALNYLFFPLLLFSLDFTFIDFHNFFDLKKKSWNLLVVLNHAKTGKKWKFYAHKISIPLRWLFCFKWSFLIKSSSKHTKKFLHQWWTVLNFVL